MSKVITFAQKFLSDHPKAGQPTGFVKSILRQQGILINKDYKNLLLKLNSKKLFEGKLSYADIILFIEDLIIEEDPSLDKKHTIRAGHRFKEGEYFSPRVWSNRPYNSPQIIFLPDLEIEKTWNFEIHDATSYINYSTVHFMEGYEKLSANDGLSVEDFLDWFKFPQPFDGQIICYDKNVKY